MRSRAERLGVSAGTVRRRLKKGELVGEKEPTPQDYEWRILLPVDESDATEPQGDAIELELLRERIDELEEERDAWREQALRSGEAERELRILLRGAQELALPARATPQAGDSQAKGAVRRFWHWLRGASGTYGQSVPDTAPASRRGRCRVPFTHACARGFRRSGP